MNLFYNNKHTFQVFLVFLILFFGKNGFAQTSITGKITDKETGEEMIAANIQIYKNGNFIQGVSTDIDGNYSLRIDPGTYDVEVSYTGYTTQKITDIVAIEGWSTKLDVQIKSGGIIWVDGCGSWTIPMIRQDRNPNKMKITSGKIRNLPTRNINEILSMAPGVSFSQ